ncbi:MAG: DUF554 domain-containing protein [Oscillospiraceae bacterium]|jgi:uncharacterized membrane protein YqgA involved in biofilm formation
MIAAVVNAVLIVAGSIVGLLAKNRIKEKYSKTIMAALALCVAVIGIMNAIKTPDILIVIICLVIGSAVGEIINIERHIDSLGERLRRRFDKSEGGSRFTEGFVSASLLFCVGSMAIMGSLEAGINHNYSIIFSKSVIDAVTAITFSAAMGIGVIFSAAAVLLYQGLITLLASYVGPFLGDAVVAQMSAVGGVMLIAISYNMLEIGKERIRAGNMLPAIIIPIGLVPLAEFLYSLF